MAPTLRDQRTKEVLTIGSLFLLIAALTPFLIQLLLGAWEQQGVSYHLVWGIARELGNTDIIFVLPTGMYVGLLALVLLDRMKRVQGMLLAAGTIIASVLLYTEDMFWQNVEWAPNAHILLFGVLVGGLLGGGLKLYRESGPWEFRYAIRWLFAIMSLLLVVGVAETHLTYENFVDSAGGLTVSAPTLSTFAFEPAGFVTNVAFTGAFLAILYLFTAYEYSQTFMVLGPKRGGKTTMMTGAYHTANRISDRNATANDALIDLRSQLLDGSPGFGGADQATPAGEEDDLWFEYDHGQLMRKRVHVEAIDHGGEILPDLKDEVQKARKQGFPWRLLRAYPRLGSAAGLLGFSPPESFRSKGHAAVAPAVLERDCLILTIPLDNFVKREVAPARRPPYFSDPETDPDIAQRPSPSTYLSEYKKLLNDFDRHDENKEIVVVVTMADLVVDEFTYQHRPGGEPLTTEQDYEDLEGWIRDEVLTQQARELLDFSEYDAPLSVHFKMNLNEHAGGPGSSDPNPVDSEGNVTFEGGKRLLRELGE